MDKLQAHKVVPGTRFTVDGFRNVSPAVTAYFLSHARSGENLFQPHAAVHLMAASCAAQPRHEPAAALCASRSCQL